jgi:hypothetical protein
MEQNSSWEADGSQHSYKMSSPLWDQYIGYRAHVCSQLDTILSQMNPV